MKKNLLIVFFIVLSFHIIIAQKPQFEWVKSFPGYTNVGVSVEDDECNSMAFDDQSNIYLTGYFKSPTIKIGTTTLKNSNSPNKNFFIAKYDSLGNPLWAKNAGDNSSGYGNDIATDRFGNTIVCGVYYSSSITFGTHVFYNSSPGVYGQLFIAKYDANGNILWAKSSTNTVLSNGFGSLCVDNNGNIYATGHFQDASITIGGVTLTNPSSDKQDVFLIKYDRDGNTLWAKSFGGTGHDVGKSVAVDKLGNVYLSGEYISPSIQLGSYSLIGTGSAINVFLIKYNNLGNVVWAKNTVGTAATLNRNLAIDDNNNAFICGTFKSPTLSFGNGVQLANATVGGYMKSYLAKYDTNGKALWAKTSDNNGIDDFYGISTDMQGNAYVCGAFEGTNISYDSNNLTNFQGRGNDNLVLKYDKNGKLSWAKNTGDTENDYANNSFVNKSGSVFISGNFKSPAIYFDKLKVSNATQNQIIPKTSDFYIGKLKQLDDTIQVKYCAQNNSALLSVNPANFKSFTWKDKDGETIGSSSSIVIQDYKVGDKYFCETISNDGSQVNMSVILTVFNLDANFSFLISDCKTNTIQFTDKSISSHFPVTYKWTFGDGTTSIDMNPTHIFTKKGTYKVLLEINNPLSSCTDTISKIIETYAPMNINIIGNTHLCKGNSSTLRASGATSYLWSNGSTADTLVVNQNSTKIWLLGYYDNGTCVSDTLYKTVTVDNPSIKISGQLSFCKADSTLIKAEGAKNYFWSNGKKTEKVSFRTAGNYWVVGQSESGCFSDTLRFIISEEPDWNLTLSGKNSFCKGDSTLITANGGASYTWESGQTTASIYAKLPGKYIVTASNLRGCTKTDSKFITEHQVPSSDFIMNDTKVDVLNNKITFTNATEPNVEYHWDLGDGTTKTENSFEYTFNVTNSFIDYLITLTATNKLGCSTTTTKIINVAPFIPNVFTPNGDGINELFMPNVDLYIYDRYGKTLFKGTNGWDGNYNGKNAPSDTYFFYITYTDKNQTVQSTKGSVTLIR